MANATSGWMPTTTVSAPRSLAVSADGKYLAVGASVGPVKVFDTATWQEVLSVPDLKLACFRVAFSPDGATLAVASEDNAAVVIRMPATSPASGGRQPPE